ncbi:MAG TPA: MazG nucleotide pyrophosphohydrolase domain-containing protein, partial [Actinomycetota bacterium]|nr:MazG nucleotide pyrophosphohydrolase domain-containing protein [Actinomycetota bacterium]
MPLLVVPLAPDDTDKVTLGELDSLRSCARILFQRGDHPLAERLRADGCVLESMGEEPSDLTPGTERWGLVVDPDAPLVVELARAGAEITAGVATPPDALTAAHGAYLVRSGATALTNLAVIMARLRGSDGCPWDAEQTHESLQVHLLEEAHEVLEAIDRGATGADLEEELGDLLL